MTIAITPDQSPTAAFSASADALTARLDATASSDTDDEGCSRALVFTGQTASCTGSPAARVAHTVTVATPPTDTTPTPSGGTTPTPPGATTPTPPGATTPTPTASPTPRQPIERFRLANRCVRVARDGTARIGLRLRLALPGSVQIQVYRAIARFNTRVCPQLDPHARFRGPLRRVTTLKTVAPQVLAASVQARVTRSFDLPPASTASPCAPTAATAR